MIDELGILYEYIDKIDRDEFYIIDLIDSNGKVQKTEYIYGNSYGFNTKNIKNLCDNNNWTAHFFIRKRSHFEVCKQLAHYMVDELFDSINEVKNPVTKFREIAIDNPDSSEVLYLIKCKVQDLPSLRKILYDCKGNKGNKVLVGYLEENDDYIIITRQFDVREFKQRLIISNIEGVTIDMNPSVCVYKQ